MSHCLQTVNSHTLLYYHYIAASKHPLPATQPCYTILLYHYASQHQTNVMKPLSNWMTLPSIAVLRHKAFLWWTSRYPQMNHKQLSPQRAKCVTKLLSRHRNMSLSPSSWTSNLVLKDAWRLQHDLADRVTKLLSCWQKFVPAFSPEQAT